MRRGEIWNLRWLDVSLDLGIILLPQTARYAHLADAQVHDAVTALGAVFNGSRYPSATKQIEGSEVNAINV